MPHWIRILVGPDHSRLFLRSFFFFLQRRKSRHFLILGLEALVLPISGLAVVMITQWRAVRGISRLLKRRREIEFVCDPLLAAWKEAAALNTFAAGHGLENLEKILRLKFPEISAKTAGGPGSTS